MAEKQQAAKEQDPSMKKKAYFFIQKMTDPVMNIYSAISSDLHKFSEIKKETRLAILNSRKVRPTALTRTLEDYISGCKCENLKKDVQGLIYAIDNLFPGGDTNLFVCHSKRNIDTELEFVCGAIRMYKIDGEKACDFVLSTYSYEKSVNKGALAFGIGSIVTGVVFGALAIGTAGAAPAILGTVAGALGISGAVTSKIALDTSLEPQTREILEASFVHELVSRGHAVLQDRQLFIASEGQQPTD